MRSGPALLALLVSVAAIAVVSTGFRKVSEPDAPPLVQGCQGDCVPRSLLEASERRSAFRLRLARRYERQRNRLRARWSPTVGYAIRLAARVSGVSEGQLRTVAWCESRDDPFAVNGRYKGVFQLGWSPFGFSPYDPVANALSAALTVRSDGSWRQWECKP